MNKQRKQEIRRLQREHDRVATLVGLRNVIKKQTLNPKVDDKK